MNAPVKPPDMGPDLGKGAGRKRPQKTPPPAVTVRVCDSLSCAMAGAEDLLQRLPGLLGKEVRVVRAPCMGACDKAPVVAVGHVQVMNAGERLVGDALAHHVHAHAHT